MLNGSHFLVLHFLINNELIAFNVLVGLLHLLNLLSFMVFDLLDKNKKNYTSLVNRLYGCKLGKNSRNIWNTQEDTLTCA